MRIIKTYVNGRFYDTLDRRYLSKEQLAVLFNRKEAIKIVMHKTGSDVTQSVVKRLASLVNTGKAPKLSIDNIKKWVADQVDRRIDTAIALINLPTREQVRRLTADIEQLANQVDGLHDRMANTTSHVEPTQTDPAETLHQTT
jgi:hypothetical protein